nr:MAG TPA: hypothetical protein [Caudoviricetes sp.]
MVQQRYDKKVKFHAGCREKKKIEALRIFLPWLQVSKSAPFLIAVYKN